MSLQELFTRGISDIIAVMTIAASPVLELRGAIPFAIIGLDLPWYYALPIAVTANMLPVPFILLLLNSVSRLLGRIPFIRKALDRLFERQRLRGEKILRYEEIGLAAFVAIPLPMTGAWTAAMIAALLGMRFKHAMVSIFIGVMIAGIIVTGATLIGWTIFDSATR